MLIIASFLLSISGCGYKKPPYYQENVPVDDENVKFIIDDRKFPSQVDNNESCE